MKYFFAFCKPEAYKLLTDIGITCLDIIHDSWSPNITIIKILKEMQNLLKNPYLEKPMEKDIAKQYIENKREFETIAREWTKKYAY